MIDERTRFLHHTSISFDMAVGEQVSALSGAGTLVIAPTGLLGAELSDFIAREHVSHALITPAVLATLDPNSVPGLRMLGVGGEAVSADLVAKWALGRAMRNGYGPSEATDIATVADLHTDMPVSIGSLVHGFTALVLDSRLRPVPERVVGELYLAGPGLARGYLNQSGLTATRFVANPLDPGTRVYRTGDLVSASVADDGVQLRYLGRSDSQIKLRGNRIEPGEIDAAFTSHPQVNHAATVAQNLDSGDAVLVTYVTVTGDHAPNPGQLTAFAAEFLPRHLLPSAVVVLDKLPLTPTGKLDQKALPTPEITRHSAYREPTTAVEHMLTSIFAEVLGVTDPVGIDDDFFALGGTSLSAVRVVAAVQDRTGARVALQAVLSDPTPAGIAAALVSGPSADAELDVLLPIRPSGSAAPVFFIHPIVGLSWCYAGLTRYLKGRAMYGLQTPGIRVSEELPVRCPSSQPAICTRSVASRRKAPTTWSDGHSAA